MDTEPVTKRKQGVGRPRKVLKENPECPKCACKVISLETHDCGCKTGLVNLGNSCYISSVFQAISELKIYSSLPTESQLFLLLEQLNASSDSSLCPDLALFELKDLWLHEELQEDAFEFLTTILPLLDSGKLMYEYLSQRYCEICHYNYEAVVGEDCCVNMCVDKSLQEQLNGTVDPIDEICPNCGKGFLMKLRNFLKEPEILMVRIMRFQFNTKTGKPSKIWNKVQLPEEVSVGNRKYRLGTVVLHKSKALNHGHYLTYIHSKQIIIDDEKIHYNKALKLDCSYFYIAFYI